jgi:TonB family protein
LLAATIGSFLLPLANWQSLLASNGTNLFAQPQILQEIEIGQQFVSNDLLWLPSLQLLVAAVSLAYLLYVTVGILQLFNLVNQNNKEVHADYTLVNLENSQYPFSFMHYLFWNKGTNYSEKEKEKIIQHELAHIRGKHSYDLLLMEVACGIFWFNPVFFLFKKHIKEQHEYIADAHVCKQGEKSNYTRLMVQHTLKSMHVGSEILLGKTAQLSHNFYQSPILKRLEMMNKQRTPIVKNVKLLVILPAIAMLGLLYSCDGVEDTENVVEDIQKKVELDQVFEKVEQSAEPLGGNEEFYKYIAENLEYPKQAKRLGVEGKVFIQFIIDKEGNVTEVKSVRGIGAGCDAEAIRILENSPKWQPAKQKGQVVNQRMVLPINFKLN